MKYCENCKQILSDHHNFCPGCGGRTVEADNSHGDIRDTVSPHGSPIVHNQNKKKSFKALGFALAGLLIIGAVFLFSHGSILKSPFVIITPKKEARAPLFYLS